MSPEVIQLVLALFGMSGLLGAIVAVVKLRPEGNERAVQTSLNAVSAVDAVLEEIKAQRDELREEVARLRGERDDWKARARTAEARLRELEGSEP